MVNKHYIKYSIIVSITICLSLCILMLLFPIDRTELNKSKEIYNRYNSIQLDGTYVKRGYFLKEFIKLLGANENVFEYYGGSQYEATHPDLDIYYNDFIEYVNISMELSLAHCRFTKDNIPYLAYNEDITVKEAVVLLQSCFEEYKGINYEGDVDGKEVAKELYKNAKKIGLIDKKDLIYWIPLDTKLTYNDMYILMYRFLQQPRYKYIDSNMSQENIINYKYIVRDTDRNMTYLEYLESLKQWNIP